MDTPVALHQVPLPLQNAGYDDGHWGHYENDQGVPHDRDRMEANAMRRQIEELS